MSKGYFVKSKRTPNAEQGERRSKIMTASDKSCEQGRYLTECC
jgi:hypothetical protein